MMPFGPQRKTFVNCQSCGVNINGIASHVCNEDTKLAYQMMRRKTHLEAELEALEAKMERHAQFVEWCESHGR
jgi:hypothetical protein